MAALEVGRGKVGTLEPSSGFPSGPSLKSATLHKIVTASGSTSQQKVFGKAPPRVGCSANELPPSGIMAVHMRNALAVLRT